MAIVRRAESPTKPARPVRARVKSVSRSVGQSLPQAVRPLVRRTARDLPAGYAALLEDIKARIRAAQVKAALSVNRELIELYWQIGGSIVQRQQTEGWGKSVVERLSRDLKAEFLGITGLSPQNIWKMRAFYLAWTDDVRILSQPVRELDGKNLPQPVREIPWGHNTELLFKLKDPAERLWYAQQTIAHGWSRAVPVHQIESGLHGRSGKAITNFEHTLPAPQSDLARELLKDPYNFEFLTLTEAAQERDLQRGLIEHVKEFLLELGAGFALVGQEFPLEVGGEDYSLDLLFYHLRLRCFVVIDLKVKEFEPEHAGKMNFYLSAVDAQLRHEHDGGSIGLILCKERNQIVAEYALRDIARPMGVAKYTVTRKLPPALRASLPSIEQIEKELRTTGGTGGAAVRK